MLIYMLRILATEKREGCELKKLEKIFTKELVLKEEMHESQAK